VTRISVLRTARAVGTGLCALGAAVAASTLTVHAFDRVQSFDPVPAGRGYVYFVKEHDPQGDPVAGRTVTISVQHVPGAGASVAPCDAQGHPTGPALQTATEPSGIDGLAYFLIRTSTTPGENDFTWQDGTYTGQVVVVGTPVGGEAAAASRQGAGAATPNADRGGVRGPRGTVPVAARSHLPPLAMPPVAAAFLATLLVWLFLPPVLARPHR
jgi:hypothetical protein